MLFKLIFSRFKLQLIDLCLLCPFWDTKVAKLVLVQVEGTEVEIPSNILGMLLLPILAGLVIEFDESGEMSMISC